MSSGFEALGRGFWVLVQGSATRRNSVPGLLELSLSRNASQTWRRMRRTGKKTLNPKIQASLKPSNPGSFLLSRREKRNQQALGPVTEDGKDGKKDNEEDPEDEAWLLGSAAVLGFRVWGF